MFFDLLDNLIPAILNIYTVLFRNNKFDEYVDTIFHLWCMMRRFQRHNYDKILLAFLFDVYYWQSINHPIIKTLKNNLISMLLKILTVFYEDIPQQKFLQVNPLDVMLYLLIIFKMKIYLLHHSYPKRDYPYKKKRFK
ncbi:hypothetical protein GLOIN_2v1563027 [Rhizophagus irregularis DAOM 181602=DAOM 197198]|uniref:Uncharacterized protein n=1 Tax=Rhizophagus irregularis (strain DAOM 197198w) TaxID=1432141 RepID=A0A015KNG3_RHIIW|nr:hypothetical protein RirG_172190 [Rhizophagus irregularis DAOM 197198w]GBC49278.1 hypothetical protein GLOIN_2v1563027 [Rhizophagus irregularis DAOM 181602=DAOM 197198]